MNMRITSTLKNSSFLIHFVYEKNILLTKTGHVPHLPQSTAIFLFAKYTFAYLNTYEMDSQIHTA